MSAITGLVNGTTYYLRAYSTNSTGTSYGSQITFTTLPSVTTTAITGVSTTSANCGGNAISTGGSAITARGICWSTTPSPTILNSITNEGTITGAFTSKITGLVSGTNYYLRAYVTNAAGTNYGTEVSITTTTPVTYDGFTYNTTLIGTQTWMVENLRTTHYRNGDIIPNVTNNAAWAALTSGAQCTYNNTISVDSINRFGRLYNFYAVTDIRNIAPVGWHIPTDVEWNTLKNYLGGSAVAAGKLKETGTFNWFSPNTGATNETGFTALPGGYRYYNDGTFKSIGKDGCLWSSSEDTVIGPYIWYLYSYGSDLRSDYSNKSDGYSVRCVRDF